MHSLKLQSDEVAVEIWSNSLSQADMDKLLQRQADIPLGFDFAGVVKGAGEKCGVLLGQTVVGLGWGAMSDTVATKSQFVTPIPANLTIDESASIVVPFVTAYAALHRTLENVKPATILVTTDQDGIGLVAAQIARTAGCAVYAAASDSAEKINISRVTDAKILDINDPSFAAAVMASTDQLGVGVVFNTCGGALSELSLSVIKDDGVYIEVGRADSSTDDAVRLAYPDVKYELFDLKQLCEKDPGLIQSTLIALTNWCNTSRFLPVALRKFSLAELADAIECFNSDIAGSRTLLSSPGTDGNIQLHPHRAYIVTGGLGGIGRAVCNWLVDLGARHLEVIGRSKPTTEAESCVNAWKAIGATVNVHSIDVGNGEAMEALLDSVRGEGWPIAGVFHAAGVVADAVFVNQSGQQFETIFRSKVSGTWLLHKLTLQDNLDHFVLFSSGSSLFGSVGQANYAAANSFMDGLAQHRHLRGLPSLSINWGPWSNVGMAAQVAKRGIQHQGAALTTYEGLKALGSLMANYPNPGICVARLNEVAFTDRRDNRPFLRAVKIESKDKVESLSESVKTLRYLLRDVSGKFVPPKLHELLSQYVEEQVKEALKLSPRETIHPQRDLFELGMDSFIAVNMCDRFRDELGIDNVVTAGSLYKHNTIDSLTKYMLSQVQLATERKQEQREAKALLK
jgi:NADPH:quinone reductase-like Zn-dependent oxidoreductase/aryl carrier-like protein